MGKLGGGDGAALHEQFAQAEPVVDAFEQAVQLVAGDQFLFDQDRTQRNVLRTPLLFVQRFGQMGIGDRAFANQQFTEADFAAVQTGHGRSSFD